MANQPYSRNTPVDVEPPTSTVEGEKPAEPERPELAFDPGEIAPCWASPFPDADLSDAAQKAAKFLCDLIGQSDVAARRWEVEQSWEARLFDRGYQYLWPRRGGGWIYIPFATDYQTGRGRRGYSALYGNETNIYATYGEIITAALTRDIPGVRFEPQNPSSDADITAKDAATNYARIFARSNDLLDFQQQLAYYLRTDGRALIVTDHIIDAQQFGRCDPEAPPPVVPETEGQGPAPEAYLLRHGDTDLNDEGVSRGRLPESINEKGERQMDRAGEWLKDKGITKIVSSPVERALSSAQIISEKLGVQLEVDDRLASLDVGQHAGEKEQSEVAEDFEKPAEPIGETGETPEQFQGRVQQAVMEYLGEPAKPVLLVVHDSVISQVFKMFEGDDMPPGANTEPGWVVALTPNGDGTVKPSVCYPVTPPEASSGEQRGRPRGQEVVKSYGKLEHRVPFTASEVEECAWVQVAKEYDVSWAKAKFPEHADKIKPGGSAAGENELDRIARINATLALEASYVTGDSMVRDVTIQRTWLRPAFYMNIENPETREELFQKCPDGMLVVQASDEFIMARNESMDDHLTLVYAFPGSGPNRQALCSKLLSVQKRLNNWVDLWDQYFVKTIPMRYVASGPFDVNAMQNQAQTVGGYTPFLLDNVPPGKTVQDLIWMEPFPTAQPSMPEAIKLFMTDLPQMISHALPSLFGAIANTDMSGVAMTIQRDQALGCLGTPWHSIQMATARYHKQAVQLAARCRREAIEGLDSTGTKLRIELADLKGNILAYPESDANFPESWVQRQARYQEMLLAAATNPLVAKLLSGTSSLLAVKDAIALPGFNVPGADSWEKQLGEFEILLRTPPVPNPALAQAQQALQTASEQVTLEQRMGNPASDQDIQALAQLQQQVQQIPPLISSVPVKDTDNHEVEAEACFEKLNSPDGRKLASGTAEQQASFLNLTLHWKEHTAKVKPSPVLKDLPKGVSANLKDMPPDAAAALLTYEGLETKGAEVVQTKEFNAELKKASHPMGGPVPGVKVQ